MTADEHDNYAQAHVKQTSRSRNRGQRACSKLFTLAAMGITSISTQGTTTGPQAGQVINNNRVALSSTFTQNGTTRTVGAIDLEANNFFTQFPTQVVDLTGNSIAITAQAQALPQMNGAGMVRDMRATGHCWNRTLITGRTRRRGQTYGAF